MGARSPASCTGTCCPRSWKRSSGLLGEKLFALGKFDLAAQVFDQLVTAESFIDFLTPLAYEQLEINSQCRPVRQAGVLSARQGRVCYQPAGRGVISRQAECYQ